MDYRKSAQEVIKHIGGKENIMSAAHCATRLRLVIADNSKMDAAAIENVDGVKGVFEASGQIQMYNAIEMIVAAGVAFAISWTLYKDPETAQKTKMNEAVSAEEFLVENEPKAEPDTLYSPLSGNAIALENVNDPTFASGALGKGFAVVPSEGKVYAPFDGTLDLLYDTKHALGMTSSDGIELLVHVGLNTVELDGKYYTAHAESGDTIKKGQLLLEFDISRIKEAGYDITTPVIVTNADNYKETVVVKTGRIKASEKAIVVK